MSRPGRIKVVTIDEEIAAVSERRAQLWRDRGSDPAEVDRCTQLLKDLYAQRRDERAHSERGLDTLLILRRARIEAELERLMSD